MTRARTLAAVSLACAGLLGGCSTLSSWMPSIPAPSLGWLFGEGPKKPGPLPALDAPTATPSIVWQVAIGKSGPGFSPAVVEDAVYAAAADGTIVRVEYATGRQAWRTSAGKPLAAGVGADASLVVVGTDKGEVLAFGTDGKPLWTAQIHSEVIAPPKVGDGVVVAFGGDGRVFGLNAADGSTRWVFQRVNPTLTVRNNAGAVLSRGGLFFGTPGGRLVALDVLTGVVGWDAQVATPKGATELERIADVTSRPVVDERQVCATAFQGRTGCFDLARGTPLWSREVASLGGVVVDGRALYVMGDDGALHALDRTTGASLWRQDVLKERRSGGPQRMGDLIGVVDAEGYVHVFTPADGKYAGRIATDGSPATSQPQGQLATALWQSVNGTLYAVTAR